MKTFLSAVAEDLLQRFGTKLSDVVLVFPNKRAGLFMNQQLASLSATPVWAPHYMTISEVFGAASPYDVCDSIQAVCELHRIYARNVNDPDSLDRFYGWGEIILSDFDDIDKHLADAQRLFANVQAIKALDDSSFLTPQQEEALRHFFKGFSIENNSRLKEKFLSLWNVMPTLYKELNEVLRQQGLMYEGALYRDVVERLLRGETSTWPEPGKTYVFVGFNVLNDVEVRLFHHLQTCGAALFYWDYDAFYTQGESTFEAGTFIRENLRRFPNELPESAFHNIEKGKKDITFIAASSENAQVRYLPQWLRENLTSPEQETAVVLCNEALLQPVLHALPDGQNGEVHLQHTNITMGFPLTDTPVFSLVNALMDLQTDGFDDTSERFLDVFLQRVANHPYAGALEENVWKQRPAGNRQLLDYLTRLVEQLAVRYRQEEQPDVYQQLYNEALFQTYSLLNRFRTLIDRGILNVEAATLRRLLRTVLAGTTIPFHGEPAVGLQVMGLLETRNLDFRHLILLSVNEGQLPKNVNDNSFIPYPLKEAFGLTTIRHKIAVYAFYFYRLLQRAERITCLYNVSTEGTRKGEMSRFLRQLLAETDWDIQARQLQAGQQVCTPRPIRVPKTDEVMRRLQNSFDSRVAHSRALSPSALNAYLDCPLKFYYRHVAHLKVNKPLTDDMDAARFGSVFHKAAEIIYDRLRERGPLIRATELDSLLAHPDISLTPIVDRAYRETLAEEGFEVPPLNGTWFIARKVLIAYLRQLLEHDRRLTPFEMVEMEQLHETVVDVETPRGTLRIRIGGVVDRMDRISVSDTETGGPRSVLRIVDYKTGGRPQTADRMEQLVTAAKDRPGYVLQTFLYAWVVGRTTREIVSPALFFVNKASREDYDPTLLFDKQPVHDFRPLAEAFESVLRDTLHELFDPDTPFTQTPVEENCLKCDYGPLCGKS